MLDTNLTGAFICTQQVLQSMMQRSMGTVINIARWWARRATRARPTTSASKAGLIGLTKSLGAGRWASGALRSTRRPGIRRRRT